MTKDRLKALFETAGAVASVRTIRHRQTQQMRGFAFVEYESYDAALQAIETFSDRSIGGRKLVVNEARPRETRDRLGAGR